MKKPLFWAATISLTFWVLIPMLIYFFELEFKERESEQLFEEIRLGGTLILILLTLFWTIKSTDKIGAVILKIALTIGIAIFIYFLTAISVLADMCDWSNKEVLFTYRQDEKIKIIKREYGCGAWDSGRPIVKIFEIKEVAKIFISAREINIDKIDKSDWIENDK